MIVLIPSFVSIKNKKRKCSVLILRNFSDHSLLIGHYLIPSAQIFSINIESTKWQNRSYENDHGCFKIPFHFASDQ